MTIPQLYELFLQHPEVTTDTRDCKPGSLFFALRGASFDGNKFALQALEKGCAYAVVDDASVQGDDRLVHVDDVLSALQQLGAYHRRRLGLPVIEITGTNGKTTTKELTSAVLSMKYNVLYTQGNYNNHIGVPKTLLRLRREHEIAVIETGANHPGEIALLARLVDPDCGLITNVGYCHLEGFGSLEGVIKTKGELYDYLRTKRDAFIFRDAGNEHLKPIAEGLKAELYGLPGQGCEVEGEVTGCDPYLSFRFRHCGGEWHEVQTRMVGAYNLMNALAAIAVGRHFGVGAAEAAEAIAAYCPSNNRSEMMETGRNRLIVDAYNANLTSMQAALDNFGQMRSGHKMLILGEMRELGTASAEAHERVARHAASMGCDAVWLVGEEFRPYSTDAVWFPDVEAVMEALKDGAPEGRLILIKGSHGTGLYKLPKLL